MLAPIECGGFGTVFTGLREAARPPFAAGYVFGNRTRSRGRVFCCFCFLVTMIVQVAEHWHTRRAWSSIASVRSAQTTLGWGKCTTAVCLYTMRTPMLRWSDVWSTFRRFAAASGSQVFLSCLRGVRGVSIPTSVFVEPCAGVSARQVCARALNMTLLQ